MSSRSARSGIWPESSSSFPSHSSLVAKVKKSQAVSRFWLEENIATFLESAKVMVSSGEMPSALGTGMNP